jgi:O-acetyl-ADP-ribose deacetylase (regulator of RNase III)/transcriptional regulator with XRE-family HTH domain
VPFTIVRDDITEMDVDAVVNAANTSLQMGGGVCGAIFKAAGPRNLQAACDKLAPIKTGEAVITPGFDLPAKFVIHTAGPVYSQWSKEQSEALLRSCYVTSLDLAVKSGCESVAFPLISSGIYGYPKRAALKAATSAVIEWLGRNDLDVYLAVFDKGALSLGADLLGEVESYIDDHYAGEVKYSGRELPCNKLPSSEDNFSLLGSSPTREPLGGVESAFGNLDEPFVDALIKLISAKGRSDAEVCKRANLDRKLFSKIRTGGQGYTPKKKTIIALAIALKLTLEETEELLKRAGLALTRSQKFDVIIEYFISKGKYDIFEINEVLFQYDQPLLG